MLGLIMICKSIQLCVAVVIAGSLCYSIVLVLYMLYNGID